DTLLIRRSLMATKGNPGDNRTRRSFSIFIVVGLCCFFYLLGAWQKSGFGKGDSIAQEVTKSADCSVLSNLNVETHHGDGTKKSSELQAQTKVFRPCADQYVDYTPCHDQMRAMTFPRENMNYRERHCPPENEKLHCLIPAPKGYVTPFPWPKSRDFVPFANAPYKSLTVEKAIQNWIQYEGNVFRFPGGGTQFPHGADAYIDQLASVIPIANGMVRTALDTGCGVASWGAYLFKKNVIAMSFAPRDSHEAQVQFALERGVPAIIGVLGTIKLPYPSRSFDMAHCSRCLIPWGGDSAMYMMEVDRVLRPGGYWVLSGPPINWKTNFKSWQRPREDLEKEQKNIEETAKLLCWEKKYEKDDVSGGELKPFPERLNDVPPRISSGSIPGISVESFQEDNKLWQKHLNAYKRVNKIIDSGRYRNIMDMNAGLGSFAAAIESPKSWVMNVMPTIAKKDTLGVIFERGLIGIYHDWCEAFSTYPRTYDLIHANGLFSLYKDKCSYEDILLEMDRILRPEGAVIIRDNEKEVLKVKRIVSGMRWNTKMVDHEDGPLVSEKILFAVKQYWVAGKVSIVKSSPTKECSSDVVRSGHGCNVCWQGGKVARCYVFHDGGVSSYEVVVVWSCYDLWSKKFRYDKESSEGSNADSEEEMEVYGINRDYEYVIGPARTYYLIRKLLNENPTQNTRKKAQSQNLPKKAQSQNRNLTLEDLEAAYKKAFKPGGDSRLLIDVVVALMDRPQVTKYKAHYLHSLHNRPVALFVLFYSIRTSPDSEKLHEAIVEKECSLPFKGIYSTNEDSGVSLDPTHDKARNNKSKKRIAAVLAERSKKQSIAIVQTNCKFSLAILSYFQSRSISI
nr:probable methyltransferase PMT2 [Tanacetum cinerariifolium]